jgi:hypothetical protein
MRGRTRRVRSTGLSTRLLNGFTYDTFGPCRTLSSTAAVSAILMPPADVSHSCASGPTQVGTAFASGRGAGSQASLGTGHCPPTSRSWSCVLH